MNFQRLVSFAIVALYSCPSIPEFRSFLRKNVGRNERGVSAPPFLGVFPWWLGMYGNERDGTGMNGAIL